MMGEFDAIRPYDDSEVPAVLARLLSDKAFLDILTHFRFPRCRRPGLAAQTSYSPSAAS
jgi:hypothetical protein